MINATKMSYYSVIDVNKLNGFSINLYFSDLTEKKLIPKMHNWNKTFLFSSERILPMF